MYTMMQVCRETDMTYQTLKYYCNEGLVPNVKRDGNNRRIFDERDVKWIKDLVCLKKCGMSIQEMKEYLALCLQGQAAQLTEALPLFLPESAEGQPRLCGSAVLLRRCQKIRQSLQY